MNLQDKINVFQHVYNPIHIYCRMLEVGVPEKEADRLVEYYEDEVYKEVLKHLHSPRTKS